MTQPTTGEPIDTSPLLEPFIFLLRVMGTMIQVVPALATADIELIRQQALFKGRPTNLSPGDAATALRRGFINDAEAENVLRRHGYTDRAVNVFRELINTEFSAAEHLDLWRRNELSEGELDNRLITLGYNPEQIANLKILAFSEPTPTDVVRFAVREVYTPELRKALGLDNEFPEAAVDAFRKSGLNPIVAQDYWASHWLYPAIGHAFEMLHRDQITD